LEKFGMIASNRAGSTSEAKKKAPIELGAERRNA
jgi:hypothetical protein